MPTFSYRCQSCRQIFELNLKIGQNETPTLEPCPYCKQTTVNQIITSATPLADPFSVGRIHMTDEWRGILKNIKDKNPGSNINIY